MNYKNYVISLIKTRNKIEFEPHAKEQAKTRKISRNYVLNKLKNCKITGAFPNPYPRKKQFGNVESFISMI